MDGLRGQLRQHHSQYSPMNVRRARPSATEMRRSSESKELIAEPVAHSVRAAARFMR